MGKYEVCALTGAEKDGLKQITAIALPDAPSAERYTAERIKAALARAFVGDDACNVVGLIDRVIADLNLCLDGIESDLGVIENAYATAERGAEGSSPEVTLSLDEEGKKALHFHFIIPRGATGVRGEQGEKGDKGEKGEKGDKGEPFRIVKNYASIEEMEADKSNDVSVGQFVAIISNVDDEDNAKVYIKTENGYQFVVEMSGKQGVQGPQGVQGSQGEMGPKPVKGTDYWTEADKAEIKAYVDDAILGGKW